MGISISHLTVGCWVQVCALRTFLANGGTEPNPTRMVAGYNPNRIVAGFNSNRMGTRANFLGLPLPFAWFGPLLLWGSLLHLPLRVLMSKMAN